MKAEVSPEDQFIYGRSKSNKISNFIGWLNLIFVILNYFINSAG